MASAIDMSLIKHNDNCPVIWNPIDPSNVKKCLAWEIYAKHYMMTDAKKTVKIKNKTMAYPVHQWIAGPNYAVVHENIDPNKSKWWKNDKEWKGEDDPSAETIKKHGLIKWHVSPNAKPSCWIKGEYKDGKVTEIVTPKAVCYMTYAPPCPMCSAIMGLPCSVPPKYIKGKK